MGFTCQLDGYIYILTNRHAISSFDHPEKAKEAGELMDKESKYCLKMECMHYVRTLLLDKKTYNMVEKKTSGYGLS